MRRGNCFIAVGTTFYERRLKFHNQKKKKRKKYEEDESENENRKEKTKRKTNAKKTLKNTKQESY